MAREHRPDHRPLHQGRLLSTYPIAIVEDGPWSGRLAFGPLPAGSGHPAEIAAWGPDVVLDLTTIEETASLGAGAVAERLKAAGLATSKAPIEDFSTPDEHFMAAWPALRDRLLGRLAAGGRVLVHCRGGRGRSGMIVAALLVAGGLQPAGAIAAVRRVRPGAVETAGQEAWLHGIAEAQSPGVA